MTKTELKSIRLVLQNEQVKIGNTTAIRKAGATGARREEQERLREVRAAIRRVGKGTYGICVDCGESIDTNRLSASPWAAYCADCQEATDIERAAPARWFAAA